jgi:hypothetical protein
VTDTVYDLDATIIEPETQKPLVFLTNNLTLPALTIAQFSKARRQVELFFKWIKPHLPDTRGSHLVAHSDARSRQDDAVTARGSAVASAGRGAPDGGSSDAAGLARPRPARHTKALEPGTRTRLSYKRLN